ncbi:hypothetical protein CMI47_12915 [Candidatus Pacearchaeota archaeon]|nr:hypothetical protein [Candidatus Pacearchaeota archaeon]|tara:strand:+ start:37870 stop:38508 length:639 start_codon:yes stop_codon:yes gene_type:complete
MSSKDKMHVFKTGFEICASALGGPWVKKNPLFFTALADTDLYESDFSFRKKLVGIFKRLSTLDTHIKYLIAIDIDPGLAYEFNMLLRNNNAFKRKFYTFLIRYLLSAMFYGWTFKDQFKNCTSYNKKDVINNIMMCTFSNQGIFYNIEHADVTKFVDNLLLSNMSLKDYCIKHFAPTTKLNNWGYKDRIYKDFPGTDVHFRIDKIWSDAFNL